MTISASVAYEITAMFVKGIVEATDIMNSTWRFMLSCPTFLALSKRNNTVDSLLQAKTKEAIQTANQSINRSNILLFGHRIIRSKISSVKADRLTFCAIFAVQRHVRTCTFITTKRFRAMFFTGAVDTYVWAFFHIWRKTQVDVFRCIVLRVERLSWVCEVRCAVVFGSPYTNLVFLGTRLLKVNK